MQKPNFPNKPLNHPEHVNALIEEGKEAMMKKQMKQMMKTIKQGIEAGVMAALGRAAEGAPDLEGAATEIANVAEKITTDIIDTAKAVLAKHKGNGTGGAETAKVVPMPFRLPAPAPVQTSVATGHAPAAVNRPPPPFIPPSVTNCVPAPAFVPPKSVEKDAPPPFIVPIPTHGSVPAAPAPVVPPPAPHIATATKPWSYSGGSDRLTGGSR